MNVEACAVCRTDLHVVDGELPDPKLPIIQERLKLIIGTEVDKDAGNRCGADHDSR